MPLKKQILILFIVNMFFSCETETIKKSTTDKAMAVTLPDGSTALLNTNSSISYHSKFEPRTVLQEGEVFYTIAKGESILTVKTKNGDVEVLGTEFNMKSEGETLEVEVEKGTVRVLFEDLKKVIEKGQKALAQGIERGIEVGKAEFKHKRWVRKLNRELKKTAKTVKKESRKLGKEAKKALKNLKE